MSLVIEQLHTPATGPVRMQLPQFSLAEAKFCGVIGPNGAGKSSLIKAITGELSSSGMIRLHGKPLSQWSSTARAQHIGVLPQSSRLSFAFQAHEVVALGATCLRLSRSQLRAAVTTVMQQCQCEHLQNRDYLQLSGGEQQRVQLARVLLQLSQAEQAPLLLLDEPTSAQDLKQQHTILQLLQTLCEQQGFSALAVLHDINHVMRYCHQTLVIAQGQAVANGQPMHILKPKLIEQVWAYSPTVAHTDSAMVFV